MLLSTRSAASPAVSRGVVALLTMPVEIVAGPAAELPLRASSGTATWSGQDAITAALLTAEATGSFGYCILSRRPRPRATR
jgi:hypothetical protein